MIYYRVRNWKLHFENNRTRDMEKMRWVPVPNKHDGEGFQRIMQEKDGITIYGCWHLILQVASKLRERGTLLRDDGTPVTADILALKTGWRKAADFERTLVFCAHVQIGWLERLSKEGAEIPQAGAEIPQEPARNGMEWNGMEEKERKRIPSYRTWSGEEFLAEIKSANGDGLLTAEEVADFAAYWLEKSASGRSRLQMERTWDTRRRMQTALRMVFEKQREGNAPSRQSARPDPWAHHIRPAGTGEELPL